MKKFFVVFVFVISISSIHAAGQVRDILTFDTIFYNNGNFNLGIEDVLLIPIGDKFLIEARVDVEFTNLWQRYLFQAGAVYVWGGGIYSELVYGLAFDQSGTLSHEGFFETTYEGESLLLNARYKMGFYPNVNSYFLITNVGAKYQFSSLYSTQIKYFFGYDSADIFTHSLQLQPGFNWNDFISTDILGTVGVELSSNNIEIPYEIGMLVVFNFSNNFKLRYLFNYKSTNSEVWGIQNSITIDLSF